MATAPTTAARAAAATTTSETTTPPPPPSLAGYARWVDRCNAPADELAALVPWYIGTAPVGLVRPALAQILAEKHGGVFVLDTEETTAGPPGALRLVPSLASADEPARTAALTPVMEALRDAGTITGWRGEAYPVSTGFAAPPLALLERAAAPHFGIRAYGVHVNGWVRNSPDGRADDPSSISLWVARRAGDKPTWPGRLDHIAAGGQPAGLGVSENVVKECGEEAGIPPALAARARPAGVVSYTAMQAAGPKRDVLFVYDLELPADFTPTPVDGEVDGFELLPLPAVADRVARTDDFKDNCNLVIIDFLVRKGFIAPESPGYLELVAGLRRGDVR
jgi:8-oxo-dGTP pyrophosphatase MutT (NUDIX family)